MSTTTTPRPRTRRDLPDDPVVGGHPVGGAGTERGDQLVRGRWCRRQHEHRASRRGLVGPPVVPGEQGGGDLVVDHRHTHWSDPTGWWSASAMPWSTINTASTGPRRARVSATRRPAVATVDHPRRRVIEPEAPLHLDGEQRRAPGDPAGHELAAVLGEQLRQARAGGRPRSSPRSSPAGGRRARR